MRISGLQSQPALNGRAGVVKELLGTGRAAVCVDPGEDHAEVHAEDHAEDHAEGHAEGHAESRAGQAAAAMGGDGVGPSATKPIAIRPANLHPLVPTAAPTHQVGVCANCGLVGAKRKCSRCVSCSYCDVHCQRQHWRGGHKDVCKPAPKQRGND